MTFSSSIRNGDYDAPDAGRWWPTWVADERAQIAATERVSVDPSSDTVLYAGQDTSASAATRAVRKQLLAAAVQEWVKGAPSWDGEPARVSAGAARAALRFIWALPENRRLPRIAPDGEGDVMLVWPPDDGDCVVTVEPDRLHLVVEATTDRAMHVDAVTFTGTHIPVSVLRHLPAR